MKYADYVQSPTGLQYQVNTPCLVHDGVAPQRLRLHIPACSKSCCRPACCDDINLYSKAFTDLHGSTNVNLCLLHRT